MDVTPLIRKNQQIIQSYASRVFKVSGEVYDTPLIVMPDSVQEWEIDGISDVSSLTLDHFQYFMDNVDHFDVILLGCGVDMAFLSAELRGELKAEGLCVDSMTTGAACRTYNVLMAEGRRVICALLPA